MGGKRKRRKLPRPLPSFTEAAQEGGWGSGPFQRPGSPKGMLGGGSLAPSPLSDP